MKRSVMLALMLGALLLTACGQKGALVRPDHAPATVMPTANPPDKSTP